MNAQNVPNNIILTNVQIVSSVLVEDRSFKRICKLRKAIRFIYETLQMWRDRIRFKIEKRKRKKRFLNIAKLFNCNVIEI